MSDVVPPKTKKTTKRRKKVKPGPPKVQKLPPWNVILLDDQQHTYQYVIEMLSGVFGFDQQRGYTLAKEVDKTGRAIVFTTHREHAELKRDQIMAYGADFRISSSRASMRATIEPAA
jgi:ATP-dependent Clp protease adaptor protein ClpS